APRGGMQTRVHSGTLSGIEALLVDVEVDVSAGLPQITTVGLPDGAVREARDRIRAALRNSGSDFPPRRITVKHRSRRGAQRRRGLTTPPSPSGGSPPSEPAALQPERLVRGGQDRLLEAGNEWLGHSALTDT